MTRRYRPMRSCVFGLGLAWLALGCGKSPGNQPSVGSAAPPASAAPSAALAPTVPEPSAAAPLREPTCRALRVEGEATLGSSAVTSGAELDGSDWVTLGKGASLTLKHASSGREIALAGPARFRACRRGREQVLLARGKVIVGNGMGSRPGAEVVIATPVAGVRYGDGDFTLTLDEKRLSIEVRAGQLEVDPAWAPDTQGAPKPPKSPLRAKDKLAIPLGKPDVAALMSRCQQAAEAAEASARKVGDKNAPEPLGERAQAHVKSRKLARTTCTIAAAATGLVADPTAAAGLWAEAARWEGLWETIPRPVRAQAPEK